MDGRMDDDDRNEEMTVWRQPLISCAPCNFRLTFRVSSFKPNNVAYITANRLNFTVVELS